MNKLRVIIADDERPAREFLKSVLRDFENVEIVGEAENGENAVRLYAETNPDVVVMDVSMPGIGGLAALERLLAGRTTIIIAHRLSSARRADRIVLLDGGKVAEQGSHDELLARRGTYARLWESHGTSVASLDPELLAAASGGRG